MWIFSVAFLLRVLNFQPCRYSILRYVDMPANLAPYRPRVHNSTISSHNSPHNNLHNSLLNSNNSSSSSSLTNNGAASSHLPSHLTVILLRTTLGSHLQGGFMAFQARQVQSQVMACPTEALHPLDGFHRTTAFREDHLHFLLSRVNKCLAVDPPVRT